MLKNILKIVKRVLTLHFERCIFNLSNKERRYSVPTVASMRYEEYNKKLDEAHKEYTKLYEVGNKDEANKIWRAFHDKNSEIRSNFIDKRDQRVNEIYRDLGYKLSKAQETAVKDLIKDMYWAKLGKEWLNDNYEIFNNSPSTVDFCFSNWNKGIYLIRMNTKTLEKIESLGIVEVIEIGGIWSDHIKPKFDFNI